MRNIRLLDALFPKTRQEILAATFGQPQRKWYAAELARRMGVPASSLQRELQSLVEVGVLNTHRQGRMVYYQANRTCPVFNELHGLLLKTAGLLDVLADALRPLAAKIRLAFVYGSVASGVEQSASDVDLMVVGSVTPIELALPLREAREALGRQINPTVYTSAEFDRKRKSRDHFLTRVLAKPKLFVQGEEIDLQSAARTRPRKERASE
jgi:DNA-binding transcriptional ArsR family regulator